MRNVKKIVIFAVIAMVVVGGIVIIRTKMSASKQAVPTVATTASKTSVEVQVAKTVEKDLGDTYKANLEAYQQGVITSKISAKVLSVSVENGQYVNQGDTIATLDDQDIQNNIKTAQSQINSAEQKISAAEKSVNTSQASMEKYKINLDDAQRNYDRQKTLFEGGAVSKTDLEAAETKLNNAKADYNSGNASIEASKANVESAKADVEVQKVNLEKYQSDLANVTIKAPISGVISDKALNIGQVASPGTTLAKVNDISSVYATIQVPQEKISSIKIGQAAKVTVDGNDKTYDGTIQTMDASADTSSRVLNCKIKIDNSDKSLLPGIFAKAELISDQKTQVITVPINALVGNEGDYSVFINDNGKAKKTKVAIGETNENSVEITDGVKDGEQIICSNTSTLQNGDTVEAAVNEDSNSTEATSK